MSASSVVSHQGLKHSQMVLVQTNRRRLHKLRNGTLLGMLMLVEMIFNHLLMAMLLLMAVVFPMLFGAGSIGLTFLMWATTRLIRNMSAGSMIGQRTHQTP